MQKIPTTFRQRSNDALNRHPVIDVQPLTIRQFKPTGIQSQLMQDCRMDISDVMPILDRMKADFIRRSVYDTSLDSTSRHPDRKAKDVMIAPVRPLSSRSSPEFAGKHDQG